MDWHESVVGGLTKRQLFQPRACIFVSRECSDGTGVFVRRLQRCLEERLLTCVYVDHDPSDDLFDKDSKRILCGSRVVIIALTPAYLASPRCIRELRWAMDFSDREQLKMLLLPLHPACTLQRLPDLLADGPSKGKVYLANTKSVAKLSEECMRLLARIVEGIRNLDVIDCLSVKAWESDAVASGGADEKRVLSLAEAQLTLKRITESAFQTPEMLMSNSRYMHASTDDTEMFELVDRIQDSTCSWCCSR